MKSRKNDFKEWKKLVSNITRINSSKRDVDIAVVGKYYETGAYKLADVYISVVEAIKHGLGQIMLRQICIGFPA